MATELKSVIIVLGCKPSGCAPTEEMVGRSKVAADLFLSASGETLLITSGGATEKGCDVSEAEFMAQELIKLGIGDEKIFREEKAGTTIGNAVFTKLLLQKMGVTFQEMHIVTSCYHRSRSEFIFKKIFSIGNIHSDYCFDQTVPRESEINKLRRDSMILEKMKGFRTEEIEEKFSDFI